MGEIVTWLVFAAILAAVLGGLAWLAARTRRRGVGLDVMGPIDLIYRPHTYEINHQIRADEQRMVANPSPDDPLKRPAIDDPA